MKNHRRKSQRFSAAVLAIFVVIMVLLSAFCWLLWDAKRNKKPVETFGYEWMCLDTEEMEPELARGSLLFLTLTDGLDAGDVIVMNRENGQGGEVFRILEKKEDGLLVKSDRAESSQLIDPGMVSREVNCSVPYAGYAVEFVLTVPGLVTVLAVPCVIFVLLELIHLIRGSRRVNATEEESELDAGSRIPIFSDGDEKENFVDVTEEYTGTGRRKKYRSPIADDMEEPDKPDKFADLDFNPLMQQEHPEKLEEIEIPDETGKHLKILIDEKEKASIPLKETGHYCIKTGPWRIDITVAQEEKVKEIITN